MSTVNSITISGKVLSSDIRQVSAAGNSTQIRMLVQSRQAYRKSDGSTGEQLIDFMVDFNGEYVCGEAANAKIDYLVSIHGQLMPCDGETLEEGQLPNKGGPFIFEDENTGNPYAVLAIRADKIGILSNAAQKQRRDLVVMEIIAHPTSDGEGRYTKDGLPYSTVRLASDTSFWDAESEKYLKLGVFFRCTKWGYSKDDDTALNFGNKAKVKQGQVLRVLGDFANIDPETHGPTIWKNKDDEPRASIELTVRSWCFVSSNKDGATPAQAYEPDTSTPDFGGAEPDDEIPF